MHTAILMPYIGIWNFILIFLINSLLNKRESLGRENEI